MGKIQRITNYFNKLADFTEEEIDELDQFYDKPLNELKERRSKLIDKLELLERTKSKIEDELLEVEDLIREEVGNIKSYFDKSKVAGKKQTKKTASLNPNEEYDVDIIEGWMNASVGDYLDDYDMVNYMALARAAAEEFGCIDESGEVPSWIVELATSIKNPLFSAASTKSKVQKIAEKFANKTKVAYKTGPLPLGTSTMGRSEAIRIAKNTNHIIGILKLFRSQNVAPEDYLMKAMVAVIDDEPDVFYDTIDDAKYMLSIQTYYDAFSPPERNDIIRLLNTYRPS